MRTRFALVLWWLGAIAGSAMVVIGFVWIAVERRQSSAALGSMIIGALIAAFAWALAFVLAGSFWRPPRQ